MADELAAVAHTHTPLQAYGLLRGMKLLRYYVYAACVVCVKVFACCHGRFTASLCEHCDLF